MTMTGEFAPALEGGAGGGGPSSNEAGGNFA